MAALVSGDEETSESLGVDTIADFDLAALPKVQDWRAHDAAATVLLAGLTRHSGDLENLRIVTLGSSLGGGAIVIIGVAINNRSSATFDRQIERF